MSEVDVRAYREVNETPFSISGLVKNSKDMRTKIIFLAALLFIGFKGGAQVEDSFSASLRQLHKGENLMKSNRITPYFFDSLYFYRSDFDNFQTTSEYRNIVYKNSSDTLKRMNVYSNINISKDDPYYLSHYATYEYYKSNTNNNSFIEEVYYDVSPNNDEVFSTKTLFEYDESGRLLSSAQERYSLYSQAWEDNTKYVYFYTNDNKLDKLETYWGTPGKSWLYLYCDEYHYNGMGAVDYIDRIQDDKNAKTVLRKRIYNYDAENLLVSIEDEVNNEVQYSVDFTYDGDGNVISRETSSGFKFDYEYDKTIDIEDVGGPFEEYFEDYMIDLIKHPITKHIAYEYIDGWIASTKMTFTYKEITTINVANTSEQGSFVYPNPVMQKQFHIVLKDNESDAQMRIFDNLGRMVMQENINSNTSIDVSSLSSGVYLVKTKTSKNTYTNKIVIN